MNKHPDNAPEGICHAETVEACARVAESFPDTLTETMSLPPSQHDIAAAIRALPTAPANATRLTSEDVGLIDGAEAAYDLARDAVVYPQRRAKYAIWAERYGRDLIALARLASTPAPDATGDAMVEALRKHVATLADELEYALRDRYHLMLGYPELARRFVREMASVVEARAALAVSRAPVKL